jgi:hypothetical protein
VEYLIVCLASGLAGGLIGRRKGSSFVLWFLVSAVVPVIGPLFALVYRNERDEPRRACPTCGKVVPLYQAICDRCATDLDYPDDSEILPPESVAR